MMQYFLGYEGGGFNSETIPVNIDFWDCFETKKTNLAAEL